MNAAKLWPVAIAGVLAITVGANLALLHWASAPDAAAIEPDYYRKAVAWDSTMAERAHDATLGWRLDATLGAPGPAGAPLEIRITDAAGAALRGGTVTVEAIHNAEPVRRPPVTLRETRPGFYSGVLPHARRGLWELRVEVRREGERFAATLHRDNGPVPQ